MILSLAEVESGELLLMLPCRRNGDWDTDLIPDTQPVSWPPEQLAWALWGTMDGIEDMLKGSECITTTSTK
jgi:hypothetical protein